MAVPFPRRRSPRRDENLTNIKNNPSRAERHVTPANRARAEPSGRKPRQSRFVLIPFFGGLRCLPLLRESNVDASATVEDFKSVSPSLRLACTKRAKIQLNVRPNSMARDDRVSPFQFQARRGVSASAKDNDGLSGGFKSATGIKTDDILIMRRVAGQ